MTGEIVYCLDGCTRKSGDSRIPVTTTPPSLICDRCEDNLRRWLKEIPDRYALLGYFIDHGTVDRDPDAKASKQTEAPAPMRPEVVDLLDDRFGRKWNGLAPTEDRRGVVGVLHTYAQWIRDERHLTALAEGSAPTVTSEIRVIDRHLLWAAEQDMISDLYRDIDLVNRQLRDAVGDHKPRPVGTCIVDTEVNGQPTTCGGPLMPTKTGGVRCSRCADMWGSDELRRLGMLLGQERENEAV